MFQLIPSVKTLHLLLCLTTALSPDEYACMLGPTPYFFVLINKKVGRPSALFDRSTKSDHECNSEQHPPLHFAIG